MTKFKTEMKDGCVHAMGVCIDPEDVNHRQVMHLEHDAAYAHALVQALYGAPDMTYQRRWIFERAAEIMRGFGYDTDT